MQTAKLARRAPVASDRAVPETYAIRPLFMGAGHWSVGDIGFYRFSKRYESGLARFRGELGRVQVC